MRLIRLASSLCHLLVEASLLWLSTNTNPTFPSVFWTWDKNHRMWCGLFLTDPVGIAGRVSQYLAGAAVSHLCPISEAMLTCKHKRYVPLSIRIRPERRECSSNTSVTSSLCLFAVNLHHSSSDPCNGSAFGLLSIFGHLVPLSKPMLKESAAAQLVLSHSEPIYLWLKSSQLFRTMRAKQKPLHVGGKIQSVPVLMSWLIMFFWQGTMITK